MGANLKTTKTRRELFVRERY